MTSPDENNKKPKKQKKKSRLEHQKKPVQKGRKSLRDKPEMYDELKKIVSISITPTAVAGLDELSQERSISRSELIEQIGRYRIELPGKDGATKQEVVDAEIEVRAQLLIFLALNNACTVLGQDLFKSFYLFRFSNLFIKLLVSKQAFNCLEDWF
jgi:hypothetical protein